MRKKLLVISRLKQTSLLVIYLSLTILLSGCISSNISPTGTFFPTPSPPKTGSGRYCLTKEELEAIKAQPIAFTCNRTDIDGTTIVEENIPYVLAAEDVEVKRIFIHEQKQLILKESCGGIDHYTWKCHPPSWGSIYANTLWRLKDIDPNRKPLKNGDHFDVYLRKDAKDTENFVCKDDVRGTTAAIFTEPPTAEILVDSPLKGKIIRINDKSAIWYMRSDAFKIDIETAPPRRKVSDITLDQVTYDVFVNLLKAFSPDEDKNFYLVEKGVLPEGNDNLPESTIYDAFSIVAEVKPKGLSLQLGTFNPMPPQSRWFDIYLPESKPVIYLYPEKPTQLTVKVEPKDGYITLSDPPYDPATGWQVLAYPNGTLVPLNTPYHISHITYPYLYYESEVKGYQIPKKGFIVAKNELKSFFEKILLKLGLNQKEANDFVEYWLGRFEKVDKPYVFITFIPQDQIDRIDPITITQHATRNTQHEIQNNLSLIAYHLSPTSIRVRAYFKPLEKPITVEPQILPIPPQRRGFTLVEWGGILDE